LPSGEAVEEVKEKVVKELPVLVKADVDGALEVIQP
jgi:hypothetical protein